MMKLYFFIVICFVFSVIVSHKIRNFSSTKGTIGEHEVRSILKKLDKEKYILLNDILLRTDRGTTQIDHIVCSRYGIFVIETKFYDGWISGTENGTYWTQTLYKNKNQFMNPLHQNYGHVKTIETLLARNGFPNATIIPIVTFPGTTQVKVTTTHSNIVCWGDLPSFIKEQSKTEKFTSRDLERIAEIIRSNNIQSKAARRQHIKDAQNKKQMKQEEQKVENRKAQSGLCPKCGGTLIPRNGKHGTFYGCSNYPKCRYIWRQR